MGMMTEYYHYIFTTLVSTAVLRHLFYMDNISIELFNVFFFSFFALLIMLLDRNNFVAGKMSKGASLCLSFFFFFAIAIAVFILFIFFCIHRTKKKSCAFLFFSMRVEEQPKFLLFP